MGDTVYIEMELGQPCTVSGLAASFRLSGAIELVNPQRSAEPSQPAYEKRSETARSHGEAMLSPPSNLTVTALGPSQIVLTWQDNSASERSFRIKRQAGQGKWTRLAVTNPNVTTYTDTTVTCGTQYCYKVVAVRQDNSTTAPTNVACVTPACCQPPGALVLTADAVCDQDTNYTPGIWFQWNDDSGADSFDFYLNGNLYQSDLASDSAGIVVSNLVAGTTYSGMVTGRKTCGTSTSSNTASDTAPSNCSGCMPGSFTASASSSTHNGSCAVHVTWTASSGANTYAVYRDGGSIATGLTSLDYWDTNVSTGSSHSYLVKAYKNGCSTPTSSNTATCTVSCTCGLSISGQPGCYQNTIIAVVITPTTTGGFTTFDFYVDGSFSKSLAAGSASYYYAGPDVVPCASFTIYAVGHCSQGGTVTSNSVTVTIPCGFYCSCSGCPSPPGNAQGTAYCDYSGSEIPMPYTHLTWTASSGSGVTYDIVKGGGIIHTGLLATYYDDYTVASCDSPTYVIRAVNASGTADSSPFNVPVPCDICGGSGCGITLYTQPAHDPNHGYPAIYLQWSDVSNANLWNIWRDGVVSGNGAGWPYPYAYDVGSGTGIPCETHTYQVQDASGSCYGTFSTSSTNTAPCTSQSLPSQSEPVAGKGGYVR